MPPARNNTFYIIRQQCSSSRHRQPRLTKDPCVSPRSASSELTVTQVHWMWVLDPGEGSLPPLQGRGWGLLVREAAGREPGCISKPAGASLQHLTTPVTMKGTCMWRRQFLGVQAQEWVRKGRCRPERGRTEAGREREEGRRERGERGG